MLPHGRYMVITRRMTPEREQHLLPTIAVLAMCTASAQWGTSAVNAALPEMASWAGSTAHAQWAVVSYLLALTAASLVVGYLGDLLGRIGVLQGGLLLFGGASVLCALAPTIWILILGRVLQGVGAASMTALPLALVRDKVPAERSGIVMGTLGTAMAIGTASGPALGGLLIGVWGWPAIFWAMLPLALVLLGAWLWMGAGENRKDSMVRSTRQRTRSDFDLLGTATLVALIAILSFVFTTAKMAFLPLLGLLLTALMLLVFLVLIERRVSHPILPADMLRHPVVAGGALLNVTVAAIMMSTLVVGPFYLTGALGLGTAAMGVAMSAGPLTSVCVGVLAGRLVDRGTPERLLTLGILLMAVAASAFAVLPPLIGLPGYLTGTVLLAPGYQLFMAANNTQVMRQVPGVRRGTTAGLLSLSRSIGQVIGASLIASFFAVVVGGPAQAPRPDFDTGLHVVFGALALILLVAALVSRVLGRRAGTELAP